MEDRLTHGSSPATLAGLAAMIAQMVSQTRTSLLSVTLTSFFRKFSDP